MKKIAFILASLLLLSSCAKRGTITGGAKDTIAPKIIFSSPDNFTSDFKGNEIKITFNELIKIKDINKQLIISPPMKKQPIIVPQGSASKFISIKILDTLQPNTTYSFNFGQSITDNNEGNPYSQFKYVFSTGKYIDSLTIVGKIKDAYEQKPDNFVSVMLYDAATFNDSTVYKKTPLYITNTLDSLKAYSLENLKEGTYKIIALKDKSNNNLYNPGVDKIGFLDFPITIPTTEMYELELFKEKLPFKAEKPTQESNNKLFLGYEGDFKNTKISASYNNKEVPIKIAKFPEKNKDSVLIFYPNVKMDSIQISVNNGSYHKSFVTKLKDLKEADSLSIEKKTGGILPYRDSFVIKSKTPITQIDESKITLRNKDSVLVKLTAKIHDFDREISFDFKKEENEKYTLELLPGAIKDFYESTNDTLKYNFSTKQLSDYGNLKVNLMNTKRFPIIVELLEKENVLYRMSSATATSFYFETIEPKLYTLRIIYDDNSNGEWDTGDYLAKKQAEQIIYFPKLIDVRANWDVEQDFILD
ncbi:Ig-like domain-containing protein [Flavobacterium sp. HXWNR69]|uniref:Ig-like domain-containing protein n=1 Tax=Flavobacterium fragile TaxID=2949085 RepID=A0ABT0TEN0_9FLAO|nr:Ig-like domain-containing protein [Flavobacterium sp. HXWNR69]MCL9769322.1 Ig-like domain-containing protein [Flavobacterium sp. HXWNR69]